MHTMLRARDKSKMHLWILFINKLKMYVTADAAWKSA